MASAQLGDDVFGEDPSVNRLQEMAAERFGKEAALFVCSGTMGNLIGLLINTNPGQEVIADADSHVLVGEENGAAAIGRIQIVPIETTAGMITPEQIASAIRLRSTVHPHAPRTTAVSFENTHNRHGGIAWPLAALRAASLQARSNGIAVHIDGARIFNAALAVDANVKDLAACADTLTFCLSKGLGAPAGSVLVGPAEKIAQGKRWRKRLGGGMRQIGMLAGAGLYALDHMVDRLAEDHDNAKKLALGLAEITGITLDLARVQTNIVIFDLVGISRARFLDECMKGGLIGRTSGATRIRFVTHYGIDARHVICALNVVSGVMKRAGIASSR
jgi:threonine aldolase